MKYTITFIVISLSLVFCGSNNENSFTDYNTPDYELAEESGMQAPRSMSMNSKQSNLSKQNQIDSDDRRIIRTGNITAKVTGLENKKALVDSILNSLNGYYANENFLNNPNRNTYHLNMRIPALEFENFIITLSSIGTIKNKDISSRDVTEEFVDLTIRLKNSLVVLERYRELLAKANTVKDIILVQEKLHRIEVEIESRKGRLQFLENQTSFASLHLELYEELKYKPEKPKRDLLTNFQSAISDGWNHLLNVGFALLSVWPFILVLIVIWFFRRKLYSGLMGDKK